MIRIRQGKTCIMGVLNVTPDSFSDGGKFFDMKRAVSRAIEMAASGADIIDIGGESTRPLAREVSADEELRRVIPVIRSIVKKSSIPISIDTRKSIVAEEAINSGASIINDVSGLRNDIRIAEVAARSNSWLVVMHMKGTPQDMQRKARYSDLISEIKSGLRESIKIAKRAGVDESKIIIDPGIGFGKTVRHNLEILAGLDEFKSLGHPICIGTSRKSFIGKILGVNDPEDRLAGTLATCAIAIANGANILRVHDVKEVSAAARIVDSILSTKASAFAFNK